ncbi:hypothetical protein COW64_12340 [bacterium (Candidatus Blackallbacteria) CG18_big_fil_WC_8_21_14_2_50_49_26]|nr:MAG: hypothetical protein COW64_12340 [bacterium (Candidatus Blackallbacteria) CG18_big_fil_WC_8_21_14_2_50_49_26]
MTAFVTLSKAPSLPLSPDGKIEDVVLRSSAEAGYLQTRPRTTRARRSWGVRYPVLDATDTAALRAFEITTLRNGADSFSWTHPISGTSYTVRLAGQIDFSTDQHRSLTGASFTLQEV